MTKTTPTSDTSSQPRGRASRLARMLSPLALSLLLPAGAALAQNDPAVGAILELHRQAQYEAAASRGLNELLVKPWNHQLRFVVADSLQRLGRTEEAIAQLEALEGTPYADTARTRLQALRASRRPAPQAATSASMPQAAAPLPAAPLPQMPQPAAQTSPSSAYQPTPQVAQAYQNMPRPPVAPVAPAAPAVPEAAQGSATAPRGKAMLPYVPSPLISQSQYISPTGAAVVDRRPSAPKATEAKPEAAAPEPARSAAAKAIVDLNLEEKYYEVGTEGLALLATEKPDDEVRLMIANALAWTGRLKEAQGIYQSLTGGAYANDAKIGIANINRWRGRDDLALPMYKEVLAADASNAGANEGVALAMRELRPRTTLNVGSYEDSSDIRRKSGTLTHRWHDGKGPNVYEVEVARFKDRQISSNLDEHENVFTGRYQANNLQLKPTFEIGMSNNGADRGLYGGVSVKVGENEDILEVSKVNWGVLATNPLAINTNLSATHIGLQATRASSLGNVTGRLDRYNISDGNNITTGSLRLASNWRPLGNHVKPFAGMEFREAKFFSPAYWSPNEGFGTVYGGLTAEWDSPDATFYASGQVGERLYGEAGQSWSASMGGKYWIATDMSAGFSLWSMASRRNGAPYRAKSANVIVEKLW
ncbi:hypothetical protein [Noviherbaspirillum galbum]|uniref:Tetratricopeptide repeat protein n=1 Tax=Noviherbaspirillum galbum TaxID=2709383 RepID=A0A6B3SGL4_9BURK|nr:hypothetical protein [Noviherbaspirillum galbum]NEX60017.1 hypothetical protein [Noviherbaspirillum galbum]